MNKWVVSVGIVWLLCCYNVVAEGEAGGESSDPTAPTEPSNPSNRPDTFNLDPDAAQHYLFSEEKDMHFCTCDMIKDVCDYRCCCDSKCNEDDVNNWKSQGLCVDKEYSNVSDLTCQDDTFDYNTNKSGMNFFDQVKQLLCVKVNNLKDKVGEFYSKDGPKLKDDYETLFKEWKNKIWKNSDNGARRLRQLENKNNKTPKFYSSEDRLWNETQIYDGFELNENNFQFNLNSDIEITKEGNFEVNMFKYGEKSQIVSEDNIITLTDTTLDTSNDWYLFILTAKFGLKTNPLSYILHAELRSVPKEDPDAKAKLKIRFKDVTEYDN